MMPVGSDIFGGGGPGGPQQGRGQRVDPLTAILMMRQAQQPKGGMVMTPPPRADTGVMQAGGQLAQLITGIGQERTRQRERGEDIGERRLLQARGHQQAMAQLQESDRLARARFDTERREQMATGLLARLKQTYAEKTRSNQEQVGRLQQLMQVAQQDPVAFEATLQRLEMTEEQLGELVGTIVEQGDVTMGQVLTDPEVARVLAAVRMGGMSEEDALRELDVPVSQLLGGLAGRAWTRTNQAMMEGRGDLAQSQRARNEFLSKSQQTLTQWGEGYRAAANLLGLPGMPAAVFTKDAEERTERLSRALETTESGIIDSAVKGAIGKYVGWVETGVGGKGEELAGRAWRGVEDVLEGAGVPADSHLMRLVKALMDPATAAMSKREFAERYPYTPGQLAAIGDVLPLYATVLKNAVGTEESLEGVLGRGIWEEDWRATRIRMEGLATSMQLAGRNARTRANAAVNGARGLVAAQMAEIAKQTYAEQPGAYGAFDWSQLQRTGPDLLSLWMKTEMEPPVEMAEVAEAVPNLGAGLVAPFQEVADLIGSLDVGEEEE